jgi:hypothetical protein
VVGDSVVSAQPERIVPRCEDRETLLSRVGGDSACAERLISHAHIRCPADPVGLAVWQLERDRKSWR